MKGFAMIEKGRVGWLEKEDPVLINPEDVMIRTTGAAMCTSDVHLVESGMMPSMNGNFIGHEAVGVVEEVGEKVRDFKPGDRVAIHDMSPFFGDEMSQHGMSNFSPDSGRTTSPHLQGMFSEKILFERADSGLAHIPDTVTDIQALMATDMIPTAYTGLEYLDIKYGETVAVIGIGPVGLMGVEGAAIGGAGKIIAVGSRPKCRKAAKEFGASAVINYKDGPILEQILKANGGKPVDKVLICGGDDGVIMDAFKMCRVGGRIANVAMFLTPSLSIPAFGGGDKEYRAMRIRCGRFWMERLMALIAEGRIHPEKAVSHVFEGFESIPEAFDLMWNKGEDVIKSVSIW